MNATDGAPDDGYLDPNSELQRRRDEAFNSAVEILHDEFESVIVLVSDHNGGKLGTYHAWATRGNTYAADGMVHAYLGRPNSIVGDRE